MILFREKIMTIKILFKLKLRDVWQYKLNLIIVSLFAVLTVAYFNDAFVTIPNPEAPDLDDVNEQLNYLEKDALEKSPFQKYVIISLNINADPGYFYHLPIVALTWRRISYESLFIIVHSDRSTFSKAANLTISYLRQMNVGVFFFKAERNYEITTAMVVREMSGLLPESFVKENDFIMTSDADLYPLNPSHYVFACDDSIKLWNADCCGSFKHKRSGGVEREYVMLPMGHIGMRKYQWREVMGLEVASDQMDGPTALRMIKKFNGEVLQNDKVGVGSDYWYVDQKMVSVYVDK